MSLRVTGGEARGRPISSSKGVVARPTSAKIREAFFNIIGPRIESANFLDLFSGTGIMGIEALSRGANELTAVEINGKQANLIEKNLETLGYYGEIYKEDVRSAASKLTPSHYDIIFADPPYQTKLPQATIYLVNRHNLLKADGIFIIEHAHNVELEFDKTKLKPYDERKYGQTLLTFIKTKEESDD